MIYFLRMAETNFYKVGYTSKSDSRERIAQLQTSCPRKLILQAIGEGTEKDEQIMHLSIWQYKTDGGEEWFELPENIARDLIERLGKNGQQEVQRSFSGPTPADVRPLRWGQQHQVTTEREDVSDPGTAFDHASYQHHEPVVRRKY